MKLLRILAATMLLGSALAARAETIWEQTWDFQSVFGISTRTPDRSNDVELADDFDLNASIDRVTIHGGRDWNPPPDPHVTGAYVRFYNWSSGIPGALLYEEFVPVGDRLRYTDNVDDVTAVLEHPFESAGKTFVSVQLLIDQGYYWYSSRSNSPRMSPVMMRDRQNGGGWTRANFYGELNCDACFSLGGEIDAPAVIGSLDKSAATKSGRVQIFANNIGETQGTGRVLVNGQEAWVTQWGTDGIHFYIPESTTPGPATVQIDNGSGLSEPKTIEVLERTADAHVAWKLQAEGPWIEGNFVGQDGSVYFTSQSGLLYCLTRDGGLKWLANYAADFNGVIAGSADGHAYVAAQNSIKCFNSQGQVEWTFTDPAPTTVIAGPTLGPDGNLYAATRVEDGGLGMFSLTPAGELRWSNPVVSKYGTGSQVIAFSSGKAIVSLDQHTLHNTAQTLAFDLTSGSIVWAVDQGANGPVKVDADGNIFTPNFGHQVVALDAHGNLRWTAANPNNGFDVSSSGKVIGSGIQTGYRLFGLNQEGVIDWSTGIEDVMPGPAALDPTGTTLIMAARQNYGEPGAIVSYDAQGNRIWKQMIPDELNTNVVPTGTPVYSLDGELAYVASTFPQYGFNQYSYVFAVNVDHSQGEQAPVVTSLAVDPDQIESLGSAIGSVRLDKPAPEGGVKVFLSSDDGWLLSLPSWVVVPEGSDFATFDVSGGWAESNSIATIRAELGGVVTARVTILAVPAYLAGVDLNPSEIEAGLPSRGMVRLEGVAPAGGATITLFSSNPDVLQVPQTVTIPEGAVKAWFDITTSAVEDATEVDVWATYDGQEIGAFATVYPGGGHPLFESLTPKTASYDGDKQVLFVVARDTVHSAKLTVFDGETGERIGNLTNHGGGLYQRPFKVTHVPSTIQIVSSVGATATKIVKKK